MEINKDYQVNCKYCDKPLVEDEFNPDFTYFCNECVSTMRAYYNNLIFKDEWPVKTRGRD